MTWYRFSISDRYQEGGLQPYLPVRIINPETGNSIIAKGLIDTGALRSKFPTEYAKTLNLQNGGTVEGKTAGGQVKGNLCHCFVDVLDMDEKKQPKPEIILKRLEGESFVFGECIPITLLGLRDFLKDYYVKIDYPKQMFSIKEIIPK